MFTVKNGALVRRAVFAVLAAGMASVATGAIGAPAATRSSIPAGAVQWPEHAAKKRYILTVLTNAVPGREAEFDAWYSNVHLAEVLAIPGFVRAERFKVVPMPGAAPQWSFFAIYEMETANPQAVMNELMRRYAAKEMTNSAAMSPTWYFGAFEPISPAEKK